ncbi:hypothetical protein ACF0H5_014353 [Mactra antiquata]
MESYIGNSKHPVFMLTTQQRKMKRAVPETEKDEQYWKRRCKNNIAAKKSRENRKQHEARLQIKVLQLEEENIILKKELGILKKMLKIPSDISMLSDSELEECQKSALLNSAPQLSPSPSEPVLYQYLIKEEQPDSYCEIQPEPVPEIINNLPHLQLIPSTLRDVMQQHGSHVASHCVTSGDDLQTYNDPVSELSNIKDSCSSSNGGDEDIEPTDLSTKRKIRNINSSDVIDDNIEVTVISDSDTSSKDDDISDDDEVVSFNDEIKSKLQFLSDQVEKMQRLVCDPDSLSR